MIPQLEFLVAVISSYVSLTLTVATTKPLAQQNDRTAQAIAEWSQQG